MALESQVMAEYMISSRVVWRSFIYWAPVELKLQGEFFIISLKFCWVLYLQCWFLYAYSVCVYFKKQDSQKANMLLAFTV